MQTESLSHSSLAWLCTCKTTHSGGLAMYLCQNRDSVNEKSLRTSPVMSCGWIRCGALYWLPSRGPGMNSLIIFGWCGCAFYSMVRKASLGYMVACQIHWPTLLVLTCMSFFVSVVLPITSWFGKQEFFYTTFAQPASGLWLLYYAAYHRKLRLSGVTLVSVRVCLSSVVWHWEMSIQCFLLNSYFCAG